jgi:hypothetical protein
VISLAGVGDLEAFARFVPLFCGPGVIDRLAPSADVYSEISPAALPAPSAKVVMISGILDRLVPPYVARDYGRAVRRNQPHPLPRRRPHRVAKQRAAQAFSL